MREITKTRLHLKVASPDPDENVLVIIPQPPWCDPIAEIHDGGMKTIEPEDHRVYVGTPDEVEAKRNETITTEEDKDNGETIPNW